MSLLTVTCSWEKGDEDNLREKLQVPLRLFDGNSLLKETELPFSLVDLPQVFSNFRKQVERIKSVVPFLSRKFWPPSSGLPPGIIPNLEDLGFEPFIRIFIASILCRWGDHSFVPCSTLLVKTAIKTYKETRNGMLKADDSTKLSPWLALGCLSPKHVYQEVRRYENDVVTNHSTYG